MATDHNANYFNILAPGEDQVAMFNGSVNGNQYEGILPGTGDYEVRVYMMRSAARRNEVANYSLAVSITGRVSGAAPAEASTWDVKVKDTPYHATGKIHCSMGDSAPSSLQCKFGVIRCSSGNVEVHVTPPGGFKRVLIFDNGKVTAGGDESKVKAARSSDLWPIDVNDDEHYQIPDAAISGG